jgi:COMPASS component SWD1
LFIAVELSNPKSLNFAVALFEAQPQLLDLTIDDSPVRKVLTSAPRRDGSHDDDAKFNTTIVRYSPSGEYLFAGTNKGWINIISTLTGEIIASSKVTSSILLLIQLNHTGREMVVNSSDRIIRTFTLPDFDSPSFNPDSFYLEPEHKFQDLIDKAPWNHVCWSNSSEFVIAAARQTHRLSIWERNQGSLSKILELPEEITVVEVLFSHSFYIKLM